MGVYVNQKCWSCKKSLSGGYVRNYAGIGEPLFICPKCQALNSDADRVTEWQLMSRDRKTSLVFALTSSTFGFYGFGGFVVATLLLTKDFISTSLAWVGIVVACLIAGFTRLFLYFRRAIKASDIRMSDPAYREKMRTYGLDRDV